MTPLKKEAVKLELTYYGRPSGREILSARLGELIESYNKETEKENEILETTKKEVKGMAEEIIKVAEESQLRRQEERHTQMSEAVNNIQEMLAKLDEEEKYLCKLASGLSQLRTAGQRQKSISVEV